MLEHEFATKELLIKFNTERAYRLPNRAVSNIRANDLLNSVKSLGNVFSLENASQYGIQNPLLFILELSKRLELLQEVSPVLMMERALVTKSFTDLSRLTECQFEQYKQLVIGTKIGERVHTENVKVRRDNNTYTLYSYGILSGYSAHRFIMPEELSCHQANNRIIERYPAIWSIPQETSMLLKNGVTEELVRNLYPFFLVDRIGTGTDEEYYRTWGREALGLAIYTSFTVDFPFIPDKYDTYIYAHINVGKIGCIVHGNSVYYSFTVRNDGTVIVTKTMRSGDEYVHNVVATSSVDLKREVYDKRVPLRCVVLSFAGDVYVVLFAGHPAYRDTAKMDLQTPFDFMYTVSPFVSGLAEEAGRGIFVYRITQAMGLPFLDVMHGTDIRYNATYNGMFVPVSNGFSFIVPIILGYGYGVNSFTRDNMGLNLGGRVVMFNSDGVIDDTARTNMRYELTILEWDGTTFQEVTSTSKPLVFLLIRAIKAQNAYPEVILMRGFESLIVKQYLEHSGTITLPYSVTLPYDKLKRFVKSVEVTRSKFGESNTATVELVRLPTDADWTSDLEGLFHTGLTNVEVYYKNRPIFTGFTTIDSYKQMTSVRNDTIHYATLTFEEEWIRRAKETTVFIPEELGYVDGRLRSHSEAVVYILHEKLGIPLDHIWRAEDNIPLPTVATTNYQGPYTMIMGRDFHSYLENIVNNYSGWVLYRNYGLNPNDDNSTFVVYKPKPLQQGMSPVMGYFYRSQSSYNASQETHKARIVGNITVEKKRPFGSALLIVSPMTLGGKYNEMIIREEIVNDNTNPDYIGQHIIHTVYVPFAYDVSSPVSLDVLKRELALRVLYGQTTLTFRASLLPHLHYYSHVWVEGYGYGAIKGMRITMSDRGIYCDYTVTLATGGIIYQW